MALPREIRTGSVHLDAGPVTYRWAGEGPAVVLLHGGWATSRSWHPQLESLSDEFHVVAWDTPGCGGSFDPPDEFSLADYAEALAGFVGALGLERPHLVGLSWGGGLALEAYRRHPDLPRSLVLTGAYAGWGGSLPADVVAERLARALDEAERPPAEWIDQYIPGFFAGPVPPETTEAVRAEMLDVRRAGIVPMLGSFARADLRDVLPQVAVPTLLLYGDLDERSPPAVAEELHAGIPGSTLVFLSGVGHVTNLEAPDRFDAEVRRFLRSSAP